MTFDREPDLYNADVADNLATVANEFAFNYVWHGEKSGKFLQLCGEQYGAVFDETDFIEYLNTVLYPDKPSKKLKTIPADDEWGGRRNIGNIRTITFKEVRRYLY